MRPFWCRGLLGHEWSSVLCVYSLDQFLFFSWPWSGGWGTQLLSCLSRLACCRRSTHPRSIMESAAETSAQRSQKGNVCCLVGWLIVGWLAVFFCWFVGWLVGWLVGRSVGQFVSWLGG